jgi:hypothetical protein
MSLDTKDVNHPRERRLGAGAHVQRLHGQPDRIDADHRSSSRIQTAQASAASIGQATAMLVAP